MSSSFAKSLRAFLAAAAVLLSVGAHANHTDFDFFQPVTTPSGQQLPLHALENRVRPVGVVTRLLERDQFNLNLFPGTSFPAERIRTDDYGNGDFVWVGRIAGEPLPATRRVDRWHACDRAGPFVECRADAVDCNRYRGSRVVPYGAAAGAVQRPGTRGLLLARLDAHPLADVRRFPLRSSQCCVRCTVCSPAYFRSH